MNTLFPNITPEVVKAALPRRSVLRSIGTAGVGSALGAFGTLGMIQTALAATNQRVHGVLNFALALEYLEESYYRQGLAQTGLIDAADRVVFQKIQQHEAAHVTTLRGAIQGAGEQPITLADTDFDFNGISGITPFSNYAQFMALAQGFEDTGVRAYKGQAPFLYDSSAGTNATLTVALRIHSVEARHASQVRRMRGQKGWVVGSGLQGLPAGFEAIYGGEANMTHAGVNVANVSQAPDDKIQEAFDEPLAATTVVAIADPFVIPALTPPN